MQWPEDERHSYSLGLRNLLSQSKSFILPLYKLSILSLVYILLGTKGRSWVPRDSKDIGGSADSSPSNRICDEGTNVDTSFLSPDIYNIEQYKVCSLRFQEVTIFCTVVSFLYVQFFCITQSLNPLF